MYMQKFWNFVAVALVAVGAVACMENQDDVVNQHGELSFYAEIGGEASRAYIDDTDGNKVWDTLWEEGDKLQVVEKDDDSGTTFVFTCTDAATGKFSCTAEGVKGLVGGAVTIQSLSNEFHSLMGKKGITVCTDVQEFTPSQSIELAAQSSFFHFTYTGDKDVEISVVRTNGEEYGVFVDESLNTMSEITLTPAQRDANNGYFVPFKAGGSTYTYALTCAIDGELCKEATLQFADGVVYEMGTLTEPVYEPTEEDAKVNLEVFELLNLDYPGLEDVKREYNKQHYAHAANALLEYMRNRTVVNTLNPLTDNSITTSAQFIADQALDLRFAVKANTWMDGEQYYSFSDGNGGINWDLEVSAAGTEFYQKHWHAWFYYLGQALFVTGDDRYFDAWKEQYSSWIETFPIPDSSVSDSEINAGNRAWYALSAANRITSQLTNLPYFLTSDHFTGDWLSTVLVEFHKTVEYSLSRPYYTRNHNIRFSQDVATVQAAVLMPEFKKSAEWLTKGGDYVAWQATQQFNADGSPVESSPHYALGVIEKFRITHDLVEANDKLSYFPADYMNLLKSACTFIVDYIYPNYTWECFNDTFQQTKSVLTRNAGNYAKMFPDDNDKFLYVSTSGKQGTKPTEKLISYPAGGFYFLRNGWDSNSTILIYTNNSNPNNYSHCHHDNGTFSLWSRGRNFMPDAGVYSYGGTTELDEIKARNRSAAYHNTLTKNLQSIGEDYCNGKHLLSQEQPNGVRVVVAENKSYSNLTHRRGVFMVEDEDTFYVIVDEAYGAASFTNVNVSFHLCRDSSKGVNVVTIDDHSSNYAYGAHTTFSDGVNMKWLTFSETKRGFEGESDISYYSEKENIEYDRKFYRLTATKTSASDVVRFITVIHPDTSAEISAEFTAAYSASGASVKVTIDGNEYNLSYSL